MSKPVTFEPGIQYVCQGTAYQVIQLLHDGTLVARNLTTHTQTAVRLDFLWQQWQENTLEFAREGPNLQDRADTPLKTTSTFADLADLPPQLQEITWNRYQLIRPLLLLSPRQRTKQVVEERIRTYLFSLEQEGQTFGFGLRVGQGRSPVAQESAQAPREDLPDHHPRPKTEQVSQHREPTTSSSLQEHQEAVALQPLLALTPRTVSRWIHRYQTSREDIRSLVPAYHQRGPHHSQLSPLVEALLQQAIKQTYLTSVRAPVTHVITTFQALLLTENAKRAPEEQLSTPGKMTVYRYIHQLDGQHVDRARLGEATASRQHHQSQPGPLPTRPNQRVECDFAQLDLLVVDDADRLPIGRPTLAALRDKYTGYPLGIFISFEPPSYRVVMECMHYAFLPKAHVKSRFQTQHEYLAFGIPEVLVVDNAIELHRDLEMACLQLGIELQHMPVRKPWFKGSIERWFRTLNDDLIHVTPGTTFSHFLERGAYDSQKDACLTLDRLWQLLHLWIVDVYTQEVHEGVGGHLRGKGVPAVLWQRALDAQFVPRLPPSRQDLLVLLTRTATRKVHPYGIEFENLLYQSHALAPLRSQLARAKTSYSPHSTLAQQDLLKEGVVQIKYHPGDLSRIWVLDPFTHQYLEVPATDQAYTKDLSLWKHHVIKRYVQEELQRQVNPEALVLAKARIQQFLSQELRRSRTLRSRQSMARWGKEQVTTSPSPAQQPPSTTALPTFSQTPSQAPLPGTLAPPTPATNTEPASVADLRAPLPPLQEQVVLDPGNTAVQASVPRTRADQQSVRLQKRRTPQLPKVGTTTRETQPSASQRGTHATSTAAASPTPETLTSPRPPAIPLTERQHRFGIHVSTRRP
jgi:putative transposase